MSRDPGIPEWEWKFPSFSRFYYGPPEWLSQRFSAKHRRAFAFWSFVAACVGSIPLGSQVWWVTTLSLLALISTFTAETPVEEEGAAENLADESRGHSYRRIV